jgi:long-subunit acyl-CoA synthetase (AMP-forming)
MNSKGRPAALGAATLCEAFQLTAAEFADRPALRMQGSDRKWTWRQYAEAVQPLAAGLAALGVRHGDPVATLLVNRPEFHLFDTAAMHLGAPGWSLYNTSALDQMVYALQVTGSRVLVTEQAYAQRALELRERVAALAHVVVVDGVPSSAMLSMADVEAAAAKTFDFEAAWRSVQPSDVLTLIFTSGSSGTPKCVEITHRNMLAKLRAFDTVYRLTPGGRTISFLPRAHIADRWNNQYAPMLFAQTVHCLPDASQLFAYSAEVRPTAWGGVPRIWEKLKVVIENGLAQDPERRQRFNNALAVGSDRVRARRSGRVSDDLEQRWHAADARIFAKLRAMLGLDQCEFFGVGAAPMPVDVLDFFAAIGIDIVEMWGASECTGNSTINPPGAIRPGTVGKPLPGIEMRLAGDGELLVRGPVIMKGYRGDPQATAEAIDADGWLHTGDLGRFDADGYLTIVDRKKDIIINAAGKNMSPASIEAAIKSESPLIGHVVAFGDRRPYNVALIVLDRTATGGRSSADPDIARLVGEAVTRGNAKLARVEQIKRFCILADDWLPGGDELTPTGKPRRRPIAEKYAAQVAPLYNSDTASET